MTSIALCIGQPSSGDLRLILLVRRLIKSRNTPVFISPLDGHDVEVHQRVDRREHVQSVANLVALAADTCPARARIAAQANVRFAGEEDQLPVLLF